VQPVDIEQPKDCRSANGQLRLASASDDVGDRPISENISRVNRIVDGLESPKTQILCKQDQLVEQSPLGASFRTDEIDQSGK
jgi:hypothetical protein